MAEIILTQHQDDALDWLVEQLIDAEAPVVALRGLAGTGKTTMIPALRARLEAAGHPVVVGAPTHRAAMILRRKGIADAETVHAHALTPSFTRDYVQAAWWLGDLSCPASPTDTTESHEYMDGLPWLLWQAVQPDLSRAHDLRRRGARYRSHKLLGSVGIHARHYFAGFSAKEGEGILLIDEGSMVGSSMLALCQEAFPQVCLIGDPGQLPPVKDTALLASLPGIDVTEIHRQAQESPIIQLAYQAREGARFWQGGVPLAAPSGHREVQRLAAVPATAFLESPLLVWRNTTRVFCTHAIRAALGFSKERLAPGEPLVCRSTAQEDRSEGFYNNGLYRIVAVDPTDPRLVTLEDALGDTSEQTVHLEELDGDGIPPKAIPFRFGYCLTVHTAQGGEWPTVYISLPDLVQYAGFCSAPERHEDLARWAYTAITRARTTLVFLTQHTFLYPPPAPTQTLTPEEETPMPIFSAPVEPDQPPTTPPPDPGPDDVADPPVPAALLAAVTAPLPASPTATLPADFGAHEALLQGFCQYLQTKMHAWMMEEHQGLAAGMDATLAGIRDWAKTIFSANEHAQYQLSDALLKLQEHGLALRHDPYVATVQTTSPQGFPVTLHLAQASADALAAALGALLARLTTGGYTAPKGQP